MIGGGELRISRNFHECTFSENGVVQVALLFFQSCAVGTDSSRQCPLAAWNKYPEVLPSWLPATRVSISKAKGQALCGVTPWLVGRVCSFRPISVCRMVDFGHRSLSKGVY